MTTGTLTVTDRAGATAVRDIPLTFASQSTALAAQREACPVGTFYPGEEWATGLLAPIPDDWQHTGTPPPGYVFEDGADDGCGGRVYRITTNNFVRSHTIFRCAITISAAVTTDPRFINCWITGNNPDLVWAQRNSMPQRNASNAVQWMTAALITNFSARTIRLDHSVVDPGWWKLHQGATLWATMWTVGCWGGNVIARYTRLEGNADNFNHAGAPGAKDDGTGQFTHLYRCRMVDSFWCNQLQATAFYSVQDNPTDDRGGAVHADGGVQTSTNGNILVEETLMGSLYVSMGAGTAIDPGPTGTRVNQGRNTAAGMVQDEGDSRYPLARTRVRNVRYLNCWAGGGKTTFNFNERSGNLLNDGIVLENVRIMKRPANSGYQVRFSTASLGVQLINVREWDPAAGPFTDTGRVITPVID